MTGTPAKIALVRRIEWIDTDAAGVYHWTTVFRLVEAAEAELHERLGIRGRTFGRTPRVHVSTEFRRELRFFDRVELRLSVASVGRASARYDFSLFALGEDRDAGSDDGLAAEGEMVVVHVTHAPGGRSQPWPPELRDRLLHGGDQGRLDAA